MVTSSTPSETESEPLPEKEPNRVPVIVDGELDDAIGAGAKLLRMGKGTFLRLAGIEKLTEMGLWNPEQSRRRRRQQKG
jgi:hypothetical protein